MTQSPQNPLNHKGQAVPVQVECYAGHKADEQPVRFKLFDMNFEVREINPPNREKRTYCER